MTVAKTAHACKGCYENHQTSKQAKACCNKGSELVVTNTDEVTWYRCSWCGKDWSLKTEARKCHKAKKDKDNMKPYEIVQGDDEL